VQFNLFLIFKSSQSLQFGGGWNPPVDDLVGQWQRGLSVADQHPIAVVVQFQRDNTHSIGPVFQKVVIVDASRRCDWD
jgi:hypothetical protein